MKNAGPSILIFLFLAAVGGVCWWQFKGPEAPKPVPVVVKPPPSTEPKFPVAAPPVVEEPVEEEAPPAPAPLAKPAPHLPVAVKKAPATFEEALADLVGEKALQALLESDDFVNRVVLAVVNEGSPQMPPQMLPWRRVKGGLDTEGEPPALSAKNAERYSEYISLADRVSARKLLAVYARYYPLFQAAYEHLGTKGYFNDKVVEAVDDLLAAPAPKGPLALDRLVVTYKFGDTDLEALDAGQKLMVRIGPENEARVKAKLKELRQGITHLNRP